MSEAALGSIIDSAKRVVLDPAAFYRNMPEQGGYAAPVIFVLVMALISALIVSVVAMFSGGPGPAFGLIALIMLPLMAVVGSFIGSLIMFVIWKLMGSDKSFETAYRCVAYAAAIMPIVTILAFVPYLGTIVKVLWSFFLMYLASIEVHGIKAQTAMIVFAVLGALALWLNLAGERAAMQMSEQMEQFGGPMSYPGGQSGGNGTVDPEAVGRAVRDAMMKEIQRQQPGQE